MPPQAHDGVRTRGSLLRPTHYYLARAVHAQHVPDPARGWGRVGASLRAGRFPRAVCGRPVVKHPAGVPVCKQAAAHCESSACGSSPASGGRSVLQTGLGQPGDKLSRCACVCFNAELSPWEPISKPSNTVTLKTDDGQHLGQHRPGRGLRRRRCLPRVRRCPTHAGAHARRQSFLVHSLTERTRHILAPLTSSIKAAFGPASTLPSQTC